MRATAPTESEGWAELAATEHLQPLGDRWLHTLGVVALARELKPTLPTNDGATLVAAAFVHDIGYAPELAVTGFHPLDGAAFVRRAGFPRLAALVAHHGGARHEALLRGVGSPLMRFDREVSTVAALLDFCDLSTGPRGERWQLSDRLRDIAERHGDDVAIKQALRHGNDELEAHFRLGRGLMDRK